MQITLSIVITFEKVDGCVTDSALQCLHPVWYVQVRGINVMICCVVPLQVALFPRANERLYMQAYFTRYSQSGALVHCLAQ